MALPHTQTSGAARLAVVYITAGAIVDVWTALWYVWMGQHGEEPGSSSYFWCYGLFLTGLTLVFIGLGVGRIGRSARHAEAPADTTMPAVPQQAVASAAPAAMPVAPATMPVSMNGQHTAPAAAPGGAVAPGMYQPH